MTDLTQQLETEVQEAIFENTSPTIQPIANVYVAAHTGDPGSDGSANEVSAADYSRLQTSPSDWTVSGNEPTTVENANELEFATAQNSWGTITWLSFWDASSGGDCVWVLQLNSSVTIDANDRLIFEANDLTFDLD